MMLYHTNLTWAASDYIWEPALSTSATSVRGITLCLEGHWCPEAATSRLGAPGWWAFPSCPWWILHGSPWRVRAGEGPGLRGHPACLLLSGMQFRRLGRGGKWRLGPHWPCSPATCGHSRPACPVSCCGQDVQVMVPPPLLLLSATDLWAQLLRLEAMVTSSPFCCFLSSIPLCVPDHPLIFRCTDICRILWSSGVLGSQLYRVVYVLLAEYWRAKTKVMPHSMPRSWHYSNIISHFKDLTA